MWREENPCALLVEMQIGVTTMENNMEDTQKIKNRATLYIQQFNIWVYI